MKISRGFQAVCVALMISAMSGPLCAAQSRTVTIVVQQNGAPVANAQVRVAADEMDAVGFSDAQGRVTVTTTSARITALADKDGLQGSAEGAETTLTVSLAGGAP